MATRSAIGDLVAFCEHEDFASLRIVADENTWAALGRAAAEGLRSSGLSVTMTVFANGVQADESALGILLAEESGEPRPLLAVGSGTITDIVRFYASRLRLPFLSLPTAASVDAYSSSVAAMTLGGSKRTVAALPPRGIFVDLDTLCEAPPAMTAAGFADTICKFTALADWRLGALVWDEPWDAAIAARARAAAERCASVAELVGARDRSGVETLMGALLESGKAMSLAGHSRSASGAEHHLSHYWEMALAREHRPPLLHGLKVGVATVMMAELWERIGRIGKAEAEERLAGVKPGRGVAGGNVSFREDEGAILTEFGGAGSAIVATQGRFLALDEAGVDNIGRILIDNWDQIAELAASVPGRDETISLLERAGCPTLPAGLGLERRLVEGAWRFGHCLRDRFTVRRLAAFLGVDAIPD